MSVRDLDLEAEYEKLGSPEFEADRLKMQIITQRRSLADLEMNAIHSGWTDTSRTLRVEYERMIASLTAKLLQIEAPVNESPRTCIETLFCWRNF